MLGYPRLLLTCCIQSHMLNNWSPPWKLAAEIAFFLFDKKQLAGSPAVACSLTPASCHQPGLGRSCMRHLNVSVACGSQRVSSGPSLPCGSCHRANVSLCWMWCFSDPFVSWTHCKWNGNSLEPRQGSGLKGVVWGENGWWGDPLLSLAAASAV